MYRCNTVFGEMGTLHVCMTTSKAVHEVFGTPKQNIFVNSASFNIALQNLSKGSLLLTTSSFSWSSNNKSIMY